MEKQRRARFSPVMARIKGLSIMRQMNLIVSLICALVVLLLTVNAYTYVRKTTIDGFTQSATTLLAEKQEAINTQLALVENIIYNISHDSRVLRYSNTTGSDNVRRLDAYLSGSIQLTQYDGARSQAQLGGALIDDILLITDTDVFISRKEHFTVYNLRELLQTDCFRQAREEKGRYLWTDHMPNPSAGYLAENGVATVAETNHFMLATFMVDENLQYNVGYLAASINLENLSGLLDTISDDGPWAYYILDSQDNIIATHDRAKIMEPFYEKDGSGQSTDSTPASFFEEKVSGEDAYVYSAPLKINGWRLLVTVPKSEIYSEVQRNLLSTVAIGLFSLLTLAVLVSMLIGTVTNPIKQMIYSVKEVRNKNFSAKLHSDGCREVTELSQEYNYMLDRMDELLQEIVDEQAALRKSELRMLRAQINPHFLYNTLDSIRWLAQMGEYEKSDHLIAMTSNFFRIGLSGGSEEILLSRELEHVRDYLEICKVRMDDALNYIIDVDTELESALVQKLILQPIVENAVLHAFDGSGKPNMVYITARIVNDGKDLKLQIQDDGVGMSEIQLAAVKEQMQKPLNQMGSKHRGYALRNVQQRLNLTYGEGYGLEITSKCKKGTLIEITLPYKRDTSAEG